MLNGSDFEWHSKAEQPGHSKSDQIAASWITIYWFSLQMLGTIAVSMSRKGPEVGQGKLDFVEDYCVGVKSHC